MNLRQPTPYILILIGSSLSSMALADVTISEVMANTAPGFNDSDEYIELCNSGTSDVDVAGYVINDGDDIDTLVAWNQWTNSEGATLWTLGDASLIENSTVIPAGKCALILDPDYTGGTSTQPYDIEPGTTILTVASGTAIGGAPGLGATDAITLYGAGGTTASDVIDTYGTPVSSDDPGECDDDELDGIPLDPDEGRSASRIDLAGADEESNWADSAPSPGFRATTGTFEVAADGSADYETIAEAIRAASAGSEIRVHPGTYMEEVVFTEGISLVSTEGAESTVIAGSVNVDSVGGSPLISGFTIEGDVTVWSVDTDFSNNALVGSTLIWHYANGSISSNVFEGGSVGIALDYYASPDIHGNTISGQSEDGIYCTIGSAPHIWENDISDVNAAAINCSSEPTIEANVIGNSNTGIMVTGDAFVTANTVYGCTNGIHGYDSSANIHANSVSDSEIGVLFEDAAGTAQSNMLMNNNVGIHVVGGITDFIYEVVSATPAVLHNTLVNNSSNGIMVVLGIGEMDEKSEAFLVAGNVVSGSETGIHVGLDEAQVLSNNAVTNTIDYLLGASGDATVDPTNISADPLFTDVDGGDYTLQADSPCIDSGWDGEMGATDYDGNDRVIDGDGDDAAVADMGALEFYGFCPDADGDGYQDDCGQAGDVDCDDSDSTINPGATETWYDGIDQDCDGNDDDQDGDGVGVNDDCDDTDAELTDGCDETGDEGIADDGEELDDDGAGCGCSTTAQSGKALPWIGILGLIGLARRRKV